uniref:Uncharacterized protein n=2 Tax=Kalmanozyma brasiliensis (strain GHG001) TaxID=1365824 RepID=V5EYS8_KALBG
MVKSKSRPVKALALSADQAAAKRSNHGKVENAAATKRRRNVAETSKLQSKGNGVASRTAMLPGVRHVTSASISPLAGPRKPAIVLPEITIRSPTPEPELSVEQVLEADVDYAALRADKSATLDADILLQDLNADMTKLEDGIDDVLSKYLDVRKCQPAIYNELLRSLASSLSRMYCYVEEPESDLGLARLRAITTHCSKHVVTGFFHLLEDERAPYGTPSSIALVSSNLGRDLDDTVDWCCRIMNGPSRHQWNLDHGGLFRNVLHAELDAILRRGLDITGTDSSLALPPEERPSRKRAINDEDEENDVSASPRPGSSEWIDQMEERKQLAQQGHDMDMFTTRDVIIFVGELVLHDVIATPILAQWLDRFLVHTVYVGVPSNWEIECALALLATVGAVLERDRHDDDTSISDAEPPEPTLKISLSPPRLLNLDSQDRQAHEASPFRSSNDPDVLSKTMGRVQQLIDQADVSAVAREWLIELQRLRERGWTNFAVDSDSDDGTGSD